jgi:hypothetical protein
MPTKAVHGCFEGLVLDPARVELVKPCVFVLTGLEIDARHQQSLVPRDEVVAALIGGTDGMPSLPTFPCPSKQLFETRLAQLTIGIRP